MGTWVVKEAQIQLSLYDELRARGHLYIMPNISWSWLSWEADLISFTRAGYMNEFEIKVSRCDFKKDFDKPKHRQFRHGIGSPRTPNYFWYVATPRSFPLCIPDYAGLIEARPHRANFGIVVFSEIRKPKLIHKVKVPDEGKLAMLNACTMKYWKLHRVAKPGCEVTYD